MNAPMEAMLPIGTVERETGLSKDVLRVWERRYGFPRPERDSNGDRSYPAQQVRKLQLIRRLMDAGHRPGKIVRLPESRLRQLLGNGPETDSEQGNVDELLALLHEGEPAAVERLLKQRLAMQGLRAFVTETMPDMNQRVGEAWMNGAISVFEEHLYSEVIQTLLRQALQNLPTQATATPRVVLTTLPGEQHGLGLLMVHALLALAGADVRSFGVQMPLTEIVSAATRQDADIVALSFSAAFQAGAAKESLTSLRELLPSEILLWVGGAGVRPIRHMPPGIQRIHPLEQVTREIQAWHTGPR